IDNLRRFNRPAVLPLEDRTGAIHHVLVTAILPDRVRLYVGDTLHEVAPAQLQELWNGDFQLLWKPAHFDTRNLSVGASGEPVRALRQRLNKWAGLPGDLAASDVYDETLHALVVQFQRRNSIVADGIAGTRTQALLDSALAPTSTPLLITSRE